MNLHPDTVLSGCRFFIASLMTKYGQAMLNRLGAVVILTFMNPRYVFATLLISTLVVSGCTGSSCGRGSDVKPPRRVILMVVDALRKDHLSAYGYSRPTTPSFDAISRKAIIFKKAVAACSWTQPSMASLFTSTYPTVHHISMPPSGNVKMSVLSDDFTTLPEVMKESGYHTRAISSQPWVSPIAGFGQGFDNFELVSEMMDERESEKVMDRVLDWLASIPVEEKFFLYVHVMGPHWPYNPPPDFQGRFTTGKIKELEALFKDKDYQAQLDTLTLEDKDKFVSDPALLAELIALYDEDAACADHQLGRLWAFLKQRNMLEDTMLIVCSDHGEEFLEHGGFLHGFTLFTEVTDVPLLIYYPPLGQGLEVDKVVSLIDILPTLSALLGKQAPWPSQGKSLLDAMNDENYEGQALSELLAKGRIKLTGERYSVIYRPKGNGEQEETWFFDKSSDRYEHEDIYGQMPEMAKKMTGELLEKEYDNSQINVPPARSRTLNEKQIQQLKSLGYMR